jgi:hypothetical protein
MPKHGIYSNPTKSNLMRKEQLNSYLFFGYDIVKLTIAFAQEVLDTRPSGSRKGFEVWYEYTLLRFACDDHLEVVERLALAQEEE